MLHAKPMMIVPNRASLRNHSQGPSRAFAFAGLESWCGLFLPWMSEASHADAIGVFERLVCFVYNVRLYVGFLCG